MNVLKGFTLAEVLITLGIIGVVAAMTLPILITKHQKNITATKLKQTYNILFQAVQRSELDNGNVSEWEYPTRISKEWIDKYISPYLKHSKIIKYNIENFSIVLINGVEVNFWCHNSSVHVFVYLNGKKNNPKSGRNSFVFEIGHSANGRSAELRPYDYLVPANSGREGWINNKTYGCNKDVSDKRHCAGLIMYDGWKISDDYPW